MGESYWGEVTLTIPDTIPNPFTEGFDEEKFDAEEFVSRLFGDPDPDELTLSVKESAEFHRLYSLIDEISSWAIDSESLEIDGNTVTIGGEHNYGIAFWTENSNLEETCQANGIAYDLRDEGKYEIEGEARTWRPGMDKMLHRSVINGGEVALNLATAKSMWDKSAGKVGRLLTFAEEVLAYFEIDPSDNQPKGN